MSVFPVMGALGFCQVATPMGEAGQKVNAKHLVSARRPARPARCR